MNIKIEKLEIDIKRYLIKFGRSSIGGWSSVFKKDAPLDIITEFMFYDNSKKKIEDLKEYICDLINYSNCPCQLKICTNKVNDKFPPYKKSLQFYDKDDITLLSNLNLSGSFYVVALTDKECTCPLHVKKKFRLSKMDLIKILCQNIHNEEEDEEEEDDEETDKNKIKIFDLEKKLEEYKKQNEELNSNLKEKIKIIDNMKTKNEKDYEMQINILKEEKKIILDENTNIEKEKKQLEEKNISLEKEKEKNKEKIDKLANNINNLKSEINDQKIKIEELIKDKNETEIITEENKNKLKEIENERDNYKNNLNDIINEKENLNKKLDEQNKEKELLNKEIKKLNSDKKFLEVAINKDTSSLKQLQDLGLLKDVEQKNIAIKVDPYTNQIKESNTSLENEYKVLENFYDIIIDIKSVKDIEKGWIIKMTEKGENNFNTYKNKDLIRIGVIGNSNKGKSFILSRISKLVLPSGTSIKTEGLSIKYPELEKFKNRKIALLDSAGLETPVLNKERKTESDSEDENSENNIDNENNKDNEQTDKSEINRLELSNSKKKSEEKITEEVFKEKSREKLITELFLQNYIINNSDILILVVGILTYSEQKLLNRIKIDIKNLKINKPLYIIHNLKTFTTKKQVQNYIKNNLKRSSTFELKKGHKITTDLKDKSGIYYFEKNSNPKIFHLIFANEGSEAGDYYNNFTLDFIERSFQNVTDLKPFDIIQSIKERFIELSTEILEKRNEKPFVSDDILSNEDILKNKIIKLKEPQHIVLKRCFIDELGFSNLKGNGFQPSFNYYKKDDNLIIRVEVPGNSSVDYRIDYSGEYTLIKISGIKKQDKEPKSNDNIRTTREFGEFNLVIPLKTEYFKIQNNPPSVIEKKGILIFTFKFEEKQDNYHFEVGGEDEV